MAVTLTSTSMAGRKRPSGMEWRNGSNNEIVDNVYKNVDAAFKAKEDSDAAAFLLKAQMIVSTEDVAAAGPCSITIPITRLTKSGTTWVPTLDAPGAANIGTFKIIAMTTASTATIASTNLTPALALAFTASGDWAILVAISATKWQVLAKSLTA